MQKEPMDFSTTDWRRTAGVTFVGFSPKNRLMTVSQFWEVSLAAPKAVLATAAKQMQMQAQQHRTTTTIRILNAALKKKHGGTKGELNRQVNFIRKNQIESLQFQRERAACKKMCLYNV